MKIEATDFDLELDYPILLNRFWRIVKTLTNTESVYFDDKIFRFKRDKLFVKFENCHEYGMEYYSVKAEFGGQVTSLVVHSGSNPFDYTELFYATWRNVIRYNKIEGYPKEDINSEILQFVDDYLMDN
jgi:hypothetical protein